MLGLQIANVAFFVFHTILILFNVFGWIWKKTRPWNLALLTATALSWGLMGIWKGAGYCIVTDLHWRLRAAMGIHETSSSYLVLLIKTLTGWKAPTSLVNPVALVIFISCLSASVILNVRDYTERKARALVPLGNGIADGDVK